jgi:hypothetical protein
VIHESQHARIGNGGSEVCATGTLLAGESWQETANSTTAGAYGHREMLKGCVDS